jgi:hypothetical protein
MSDTPETDASRGYALSSHYGRIEGSYLQMDWSGPFVHAEIARKLERERDEAIRQLENLKAAAIHTCHDQCQRPMCVLRRERDEARKKIKRQAERICQLEGATNHAGGTPLSIALRERDEAKADAAKIADKLSGLELRSTEELARLEQERNEARAVADELASVAAHCLGWHEHESTDAAIKIAAALKRWKKSK